MRKGMIVFLLLVTACFAQTKGDVNTQSEIRDGKVVIVQKKMMVAKAGESFGYGGPIAAQVKESLTAKVSAHSVILSCTASTSSGVTGYFFYRGATTGGESTTPLNATPTALCGYTDTSVNPLTQYFYNAKAFCPTCSPNTSVASNEVNVTVPGDPQPLPPIMNPPTSN